MRPYDYELGDLARPERYTEPIPLDGEPETHLREFLERMLLVRATEEAIGNLIDDGSARCPCHLAIGQEAVAVGLAGHLRGTDRIFGGHRAHAHYLALGGDLASLFGEVLGKASGCSGGMGGSMHLLATEVGLMGTVPIVAATISIAVGAALAAKMDGGDAIAVSVFGDGATEEGSFHESLNLAAVFGLPIVFVCENNLFSSHLHISQRQPHSSVARYASAHAIPVEVVDGNDVLAVSRAAGSLVQRARSGGGPGLLEAVTYRWRGHVGSSEDVDVGVDRHHDLARWKRRDPIGRLSNALFDAGVIERSCVEEMRARVLERVSKAVAEAQAAPYPAEHVLLDSVYEDRPQA